MAIRIRKSIWSLPPGDPAVIWYRRAVAELMTRPTSDPTSWRYLAAVHAVPAGTPVPSTAKGFWDQCQHQSWFFLPWHRGYITSFEAVVAKTIVELGGPDEWALPYWNYSESLTVNPNARLMPPDFFNRLMPDGSANALWSKRAQVQNGNFGLSDAMVTLDALHFQDFANARPGAPSGFGGPVTGFHTDGGDNGGLENLPHNKVHTQIGGQTGFMSSPETAALDPIFWLHHSNIDRLWEVWRNQGPLYQDPTLPTWLSTVPFPMHDANGQAFTYFSRDMLDTTKVLHGYRYDNLPVAHEPSKVTLEAAMAAEDNPELAGHSEGPVALKGDVTHAVVSLRPQLTTKSFVEAAKPRPRHVYLNLENITGAGVPGDFSVYLDVPNEREPVLVGVMTTFGLERASDRNRGHGGSGLNHVFDITRLAERLGLTRGTASQVQVRFVRDPVAATEEGTPAGLEAFVRPARGEPSIQVGRVSLFFD